MVEVNFWGGLRVLTNGCDKIDVDAETVIDVLNGVEKAFPALSNYLEDHVSVVIDGRVIVSSLHEPVKEDSEVWLIKRLTGG